MEQLSHVYIPTGLAVVDCSASSETTEILSRVIDLGCCIVLANKKPLTSTMVRNSFRSNLSSLSTKDARLRKKHVHYLLLVIPQVMLSGPSTSRFDCLLWVDCQKIFLFSAMQEYYDKLVSQPRRIRHESTVS